ncbi:MAG: hypothetical protein SGI84_01115 [Gemmatimonadota bacterium]|nr:hypothetical protein [Gemmatimonadota bacterium]
MTNDGGDGGALVAAVSAAACNYFGRLVGVMPHGPTASLPP